MQIELNIQANNETAGDDDEWESSFVTETECMRRIATKKKQYFRHDCLRVSRFATSWAQISHCYCIVHNDIINEWTFNIATASSVFGCAQNTIWT